MYARMKRLRHLFLLLLALLACSCGSTKQNTAQSRFWQALVTRYNVYHNGNEAYKEGLQTQEKGHKDNYLQPIPLYIVSSPTTQKMGSGNFDTAVEKAQKASKLHSIKAKPKKKAGKTLTDKDKQWYARKEYNPFMHNVWMLMGKAQFQKGEFLEAAGVFAYTARLFSDQPRVVAEAKMRMAQCYSELEWYYEADNLFNELSRDSIPYQLADEYEAIVASHLLSQERYDEALPHLEKAAKRGGQTKRARARSYFLLGQIEKMEGNDAQAYNAFRKCIRQNPPYELEFNARIQQTEVVTGQTAPKMVHTLERMAKDPNNKDYLDQVYYAIGNIYLAQKDTLKAIEQYELGAEKSTRSGIEKGTLLLHLGNIYWNRAKYSDAQRCYAEAVGLVDKESKDYKQLNKRSSILDDLVEHTEAIELQDSLQHLATLPEEELYAVIDKIIADVIKAEEEAKKAEEEAALQAQREEALAEAQAGMPAMKTPTAMGGDNSWYFYNTQLVAQGKKDFQQKWGRRKLEDNWRRANKSVLADDTFAATDYDDEAPADSLAADSTATVALADSVVTDVHDRMYYLQQIPFSEEQMAESNAILQDALFNAGIIYKDRLEDFSLAEGALVRLNSQFPEYEGTDVVYYNLYLMYSRWHRWDKAEEYLQRLKDDYPYSDYTVTLSDPDYEDNVRYGKHREDSLYAATYDAYTSARYAAVHDHVAVSSEKYALGAHRPKFLFLDAMSHLQEGDQSQFLDQLKEIVSKYPENEISELAGLIAKGMQEGRLLTSGSLGTIWQRRLGAAEGQTAVPDSLVKPFDEDAYAPFVFMLAYEDGTVDDNQLLFEMARFNFTKFMVRNFEITTDRQGGITMLRVSGFMNLREAFQYRRKLYADAGMAQKLSGIRCLLISEPNLAMLFDGSHSFDDYQQFYDEHFGLLPDVEATDDDTLDAIHFDD